jgi:hypothetical protein
MRHVWGDVRVFVRLLYFGIHLGENMSIQIPSAFADVIEEEYQLFDERLEAVRAGDWEKSRHLLVELERTKQRRLELTPSSR